MRTESPAIPAHPALITRSLSCGGYYAEGAALTVTTVVKHVGLVDASAPQPDHVLIAISDNRDPLAVSFRSDLSEEVVRGDPVRPYTYCQIYHWWRNDGTHRP